MADDPNINFRLNTEGDTEGADKVADSFKDLQERLAKLKEEAGRIGNAAEEASPKLDTMVGLERAEVVSRIGAGVELLAAKTRGLANDLKGFDPQLAGALQDVSTGLESIGGGLSGAAQGFALGGPFGAAVGGMIGLLTGQLHDAYEAAISDIERSVKAQELAEQMEQRLARARSIRAEQVRLERLAEIYDRETDALREQLALMQAIAQVEATRRGSDAKIQDALNPTASPEQQVQRDLSRQLADIDAKLKQAQDLAAESARLAAAATVNADRVAAVSGAQSTEAIKAAGERDQAIQQAENNRLRAEQVAAQSDAERERVRAEAAKALADLSNEAGKAIQEQATNVISTIQQIAEEQGGRIGSDTRGAMEQLVKLVNDATPDQQQMGLFQQAFQQFRGSTDSLFNGLIPQMDAVIGLMREAQAEQRARDTAIATLKREMAADRERFNAEIGRLTTQLEALRAAR